MWNLTPDKLKIGHRYIIASVDQQSDWSPHSWWTGLEMAPIHDDAPEFLAWLELDQEEDT